jgi:ubiquinone/menaquinone biosynthesis C-methylase UbiE
VLVTPIDRMTGGILESFSKSQSSVPVEHRRGGVTAPASQDQPQGTSLFSGPPSFADTYERQLVGPIFRPWAVRLLDGSGLRPNERVLDVACGTGIVARLARQRVGPNARVVAIDKSPVMLTAARPLDETIDWREGDALALPVGEQEFDALFCHQGLQFLSDKPAALREFRRVLAPGGRMALGVWRSREENTLFGELDRVAERFVGPVRDVRHSFSDADALRQLLLDAGFRNVDVTQSTMETRFEIDPAVLARLNATAAIGMSERGKALNEAERAAVTADIVEASLPEMARYSEAGVIRFQTSSNIATAHR